jgi:hypothetical protein
MGFLDASSWGAIGAMLSGGEDSPYYQKGDTGRALGATGALAGGVESAIGAYGQARALRASGKFQQQLAAQNAQLSQLASENAVRAGETRAAVVGMHEGQLLGAQKVAFANQGVDVHSGSAADVATNTAQLGAMDQQTIRINAMRQALGYQIQGVNERFAGIFANLAAKNQADSTMLTGGMKFVAGFNKGIDLNWEGRKAPSLDQTTGAGGWDNG